MRGEKESSANQRVRTTLYPAPLTLIGSAR
jgi:hypothetical protein